MKIISGKIREKQHRNLNCQKTYQNFWDGVLVDPATSEKLHNNTKMLLDVTRETVIAAKMGLDHHAEVVLTGIVDTDHTPKTEASFALLCGGLCYLLFISSGKQTALFAGVAVFSGCMVHLILDELNSFKLKFGFIPTLKSSSGTALKSNSFVITLIFYFILSLVVVAIFLSYPSK